MEWTTDNTLSALGHLLTLGLGLSTFFIAFPAWRKQKKAEMKMGLEQNRFQAK